MELHSKSGTLGHEKEVAWPKEGSFPGSKPSPDHMHPEKDKKEEEEEAAGRETIKAVFFP